MDNYAEKEYRANICGCSNDYCEICQQPPMYDLETSILSSFLQLEVFSSLTILSYFFISATNYDIPALPHLYKQKISGFYILENRRLGNVKCYFFNVQSVNAVAEITCGGKLLIVFVQSCSDYYFYFFPGILKDGYKLDTELSKYMPREGCRYFSCVKIEVCIQNLFHEFMYLHINFA